MTKAKIFILKILLLLPCLLHANSIEISIDHFIELVSKNDSVFEEILLNRLPLEYQKDLQLPPRDIVLSVKEQYNLHFTNDSTKTERSISLSKLFPQTATRATVAYEKTPSLNSDISELSFTLAQSIAENAFGRNTRLKEKIIGLETEIAHHQITEAYEDYLALQIANFYKWNAAYQTLNISESSYQQNLKLLDNVKARQNSKIALPIDVNKITIQVINKHEQLIRQKEAYERQYNLIKTAMRYKGKDVLTPLNPPTYNQAPESFEPAYDGFKNTSRTYSVLNLLKQNSSLKIDEQADELLPSIDLLLGYNIRGTQSDFKDGEHLGFAGISLEWPFPDESAKAEHEVAKIENRITAAKTSNTHYALYTRLQNLFLAIQRENELIKNADEKIKLSEAIFTDESENYSFGRVTLNDYISAVNNLDNNRYNQVERQAVVRELIIEWLRLTDQLIRKTPSAD